MSGNGIIVFVKYFAAVVFNIFLSPMFGIIFLFFYFINTLFLFVPLFTTHPLVFLNNFDRVMDISDCYYASFFTW